MFFNFVLLLDIVVDSARVVGCLLEQLSTRRQGSLCGTSERRRYRATPPSERRSVAPPLQLDAALYYYTPLLPAALLCSLSLIMSIFIFVLSMGFHAYLLINYYVFELFIVSSCEYRSYITRNGSNRLSSRNNNNKYFHNNENLTHSNSLKMLCRKFKKKTRERRKKSKEKKIVS